MSKNFNVLTEKQSAEIDGILDVTEKLFAIGLIKQVYKTEALEKLLKSAASTGFENAFRLTSDQIKNWKLGKGDKKTKFIFNILSVVGSVVMADPEKYGLPANAFHIYDFQI